MYLYPCTEFIHVWNSACCFYTNRFNVALKNVSRVLRSLSSTFKSFLGRGSTTARVIFVEKQKRKNERTNERKHLTSSPGKIFGRSWRARCLQWTSKAGFGIRPQWQVALILENNATGLSEREGMQVRMWVGMRAGRYGWLRTSFRGPSSCPSWEGGCHWRSCSQSSWKRNRVVTNECQARVWLRDSRNSGE